MLTEMLTPRWIAEQMAECGFTVQTLASRVGVTPKAVEMWLDGKRRPSLETAEGILSAFGYAVEVGMSKQSRKGNAWQNACEGYLKEFFEDTEGTIHVERLHGERDEGDIHGLSCHGFPIVVEAKNQAEYRFGDWVAEAEAEAENAGASYGVAFVKRKGRGLAHVGDHWAVMSIEGFCRMIGGVE